MNEYIVSLSFNKENENAQLLSGMADSIESFVDNAFIHDDKMEILFYGDEAIVKYPENKVYFIFKI